MTWTSYDIFGFSVLSTILVIMVLGIVFSFFTPTLDRWSKRYFITLFSLLFLCAVTCFLALLFWHDSTKAVASRIVYFFEDAFLSTTAFMPTVFLLHNAGERFKKSFLAWVMTALLGIYLLMSVVSMFTDVFYYVTADNQFVRGPLLALGLLPLAIGLVLNIIGTIKRRKKLSKKYFTGLLVYLIPMTVAMIVHMFIAIEIIVVFCMALFALVMYGFILSDNIEQFMRQQKKIANQQASIMVLQMRPHFICNSMMGIYSLCRRDPEKARQVILDFTSYLRKNFANFASEEPVLFTDELEHARAYLSVEQAQYEDSLFVNFDTPVTHFRIPPLTLQPIVENAVVHGMRNSNDPIRISVATRKTETAIEIIVEDDGPGFKPTDDNEPHIALNNIRERLEMMCHGTLTVSPREEGGTSVKVTIPLDNAKE